MFVEGTDYKKAWGNLGGDGKILYCGGDYMTQYISKNSSKRIPKKKKKKKS